MLNQEISGLVLAATNEELERKVNSFLVKWTMVMEEGVKFHNYLEAMWFGKTTQHQKDPKACLFPRTLWVLCHHSRGDLNMTNNPAETFNNKLNRLNVQFGVQRSSVKEALELLRRVKDLCYTDYVARLQQQEPIVPIARNSAKIRDSTPKRGAPPERLI